MAIKQRNLLTNILFWIAMIFMVYFAENVIVFDFSNFQREFSLLEYVLLFVGIIAILGYYFYTEHKYNGLKPKWVLIVILFILAIAAAIGIFTTPEVQYFEAIEIVEDVETIVVKEYTTTFFDEIKSLLFVLIAMVGVYIYIIVLPRLISFRRYLLFLMYVVVVVAVIAAIVSYFMDFDSYVHLYNHGLVGYVFPQSFVFNRNMYALILMLGMLALYVIISYLPKWYNYAFLIFLLINIFFTFSKAALGIALITFVVHFIYRMVATFKKNKVRNIIYLVLVGVIGICGILLIPFPFFMNVTLLNEARRFILEYYVELGINSYDGRKEIWNSVVSLSNGINLWFGRGLITFNKTLYFYSGQIAIPHHSALFSHNGFLEILGQYGLVGLIPYCLGVLIILGLDIYVAIKNFKIGIPALIIFGAFIGYTMVETSTLFDLTIEGVTTTALVTLPAFSWLYARRHPEMNREIVANSEEMEYKLPKYCVERFEKQSSRYVALFLGLITLLAFFGFSNNDNGIIYYVIFLTMIAISFLLLPRTMANIYALRSKKRGFLFWTLLILSIAAVFGGLIVYILTLSPLVFLLTTNVIVINLLVSERFFRVDAKSIKQYIRKAFLPSLVFLTAILVTGLPIIFLLHDLTWFIVSEIVILYSILTAPFLLKFDLESNVINKKMLHLFARSIAR